MDPRELVVLGTLSVAMFDVGVTDVAQRLRVFGDARGLPAVVVAERPSRSRPASPPAGLTVLVTGPAARVADLKAAFSDLNSEQSLGPVAAIGIGAAFLASATFLPAVLVLLGRTAFWPLRPKPTSPHHETGGLWARVWSPPGRARRGWSPPWC